MKLKILILFSVVIETLSSKCFDLQCATFTDPKQCFQASATEQYQIQACPVDNYCPLPSIYLGIPPQQSYTCLPIPSTFRSSGKNPYLEYDYCQQNSFCSSGSCVNSLCKGKVLGTPCQVSNECTGDLFCDTNTLLCSQRKLSGGQCKSSEECINNAGCLNGICTNYFSFSLGQKVPTTAKIDINHSLAFPFTSVQEEVLYCKTGFLNPSNLMCENLTNASTATTSGLVDCTFDRSTSNSCSYITSESKTTVQIQYTCSCRGVAGEDNGKCLQDTTSTAFLNYLSLLTDVLTNNNCPFQDKYCKLISYQKINNLFVSSNDLYGIDEKITKCGLATLSAANDSVKSNTGVNINGSRSLFAIQSMFIALIALFMN